MDAKTLQLAAWISDATAMKWATPITAAMAEFGIDTPVRQAAFIAQNAHESMGFTRLRESLDYTPKGLRDTFGSRVAGEAANRLGRQIGEAVVPRARQMAIANLVYGGRFGNNTVGDGWNFRGGGLGHLTFRANYAACRDAIGVDIVTNPDLITDPMVAARTAGWFWRSNGCNNFADDGDFVRLTQKINGGDNGLAERKARWATAKQVLGVK